LASNLRFFGEVPVQVEPSQAQLTSDAGLLLLRQFDEQIGLVIPVVSPVFSVTTLPGPLRQRSLLSGEKSNVAIVLVCFDRTGLAGNLRATAPIPAPFSSASGATVSFGFLPK